MRSAVALYESMAFVRGQDRTLDDGFRLQSYRLELDREGGGYGRCQMSE
jgi:hypothetical protein